MSKHDTVALRGHLGRGDDLAVVGPLRTRCPVHRLAQKAASDEAEGEESEG